MVAETAELAALPASGLWAALTVPPYEAVAPYSKVTVVAPPLALTVPFRVALPVCSVALPVVAVGTQGAVVKVASALFVVPMLLTALNW